MHTINTTLLIHLNVMILHIYWVACKKVIVSLNGILRVSQPNVTESILHWQKCLCWLFLKISSSAELLKLCRIILIISIVVWNTCASILLLMADRSQGHQDIYIYIYIKLSCFVVVVLIYILNQSALNLLWLLWY